MTQFTEKVNELTGGNKYKPGVEILGAHPFDMYPGAVQYGMEWLGGGSGRFVTNLIRWGMDKATGEETPTEKVPLKRTLMGETTGQGEAQRYYELKDDVQEHRNRFNAAKKAAAEDPGDDAARDTLEHEADFLGVSPQFSKKTTWKGSAADAFTKADEAIRELRKEKYRINADTGLSRAERYRQSKDIDSEIQQKQRDARGLFRGKTRDETLAPPAPTAAKIQQAGLWDTVSDFVMGTGTKTLPTEAPAGYPSREDADFARKAGFGYGRDQKAIDGDELNVAGVTDKTTVTKPPAKKGAKPTTTVLEQFRAAGIDEDSKRQSDLVAKAVTPGASKRLAAASPEARDDLTRAALAVNRSAVATLGYDPQRVAFDVKSGPTTVGGLYQAQGRDGKPLDSMWVNAAYPYEVPHESMHRGLEKVRQDRPDLFKGWNVDEESLVRQIMRTTMGNPEKGSGGIADKQLDRARYLFEEDWNARDNQARLAAIEAHAAEMIRRDRPRGGPR
jgi:hypothetical protein